MTQKILRNVVVLGASKEGGTGWCVAQRLSQLSDHVIVGARQRPGIDRLAQSIGGTAIVCDVTIEAQVAALADQAATTGRGPIDSAVLVAGEGVGGNIDDIADSDLNRALSLNLIGP